MLNLKKIKLLHKKILINKCKNLILKGELKNAMRKLTNRNKGDFLFSVIFELDRKLDDYRIEVVYKNCTISKIKIDFIPDNVLLEYIIEKDELITC